MSACKCRCVIHFTGIDAHPLHEVAEGQPGPAAVQVAVTGQGSAQCTDATSEQADGYDAAGAPRRHRTVELRAVPRGTHECGIAAHATEPRPQFTPSPAPTFGRPPARLEARGVTRSPRRRPPPHRRWWRRWWRRWQRWQWRPQRRPPPRLPPCRACPPPELSCSVRPHASGCSRASAWRVSLRRSGPPLAAAALCVRSRVLGPAAPCARGRNLICRRRLGRSFQAGGSSQPSSAPPSSGRGGRRAWRRHRARRSQ